MYNKILESNGVEIEIVDGGAFNDFSAGGKSGIVSGVLDECKITFVSNILTVGKGLLLIKGIRVKILDPIDFSLQGNPAVPINYQLVARIVLSPDRSISFNLFTDTTQNLVNDAIYKTEQGTYDLRLATFIHATDGSISNLVVTADVLTNKSSGVTSIVKASNSEIEAKTNDYHPIVPANLDYAVKVGVTTNTETLSEEEKENAQKWLGLQKEYEHKITFEFVGLDSDADTILGGSNGIFTITAPTKTAFTSYEEIKPYLEVGQKIDWGYFEEDGTWGELGGKGNWEIIAINDTEFMITDNDGTDLVVSMTDIIDIVTEKGTATTSVEIDKTLTKEGAAADAKVVGEKFNDIDGRVQFLEKEQIDVDTTLTIEGDAADAKIVGEKLAEKVGFTDFGGGLTKSNDKIQVYTHNIYGLIISGSNLLMTSSASESEISAKSSNWKPIVPKTLDFAIKTSLTTNTNTLTDEEKAMACEWLGASGKLYKHSIRVYPKGYDEFTFEVISKRVEEFKYNDMPKSTDIVYRDKLVLIEGGSYAYLILTLISGNNIQLRDWSGSTFKYFVVVENETAKEEFTGTILPVTIIDTVYDI